MTTLRAQAVELPIDSPPKWRKVFAEELIRLAPRLNPDAADEFSDSQFLISGDLEPGPVASAFASLRGYSDEAPGLTTTGDLGTQPR